MVAGLAVFLPGEKKKTDSALFCSIVSMSQLKVVKGQHSETSMTYLVAFVFLYMPFSICLLGIF